MPKLNKIQRQTVINELTGTYGQQFLLCDGYLIFATVQRMKQQLVIACYVDGCINGVHAGCFRDSELKTMTDMQKKFMRHSKKACFKKGFIQKQEKAMGKKWCKNNGTYEKYTSCLPWFLTPRAFVEHINQHCTDIEILTFDDYQARLDAKEAANGQTV